MGTVVEWALLVAGVLVAAAHGYNKWLEYREAEYGEKLLMIQTYVEAAEQMLGKQPGEARFTWVMAHLQERWPDADIDELRVLIEAAVNQMERSQPVVVKVDQGGDRAHWLRN